jgi:hypothetical protein
MRREQDSVNPSNHADVMVPSFDEDGSMRYWYARVIGIYHARVKLAGQSGIKVVDFLHVRWFARDEQQTNLRWRLPRVGFFDASQSPTESFSFLDPRLVLRSVHLIPAFAHPEPIMRTLPLPSIARPDAESDEEWSWYYVGM